MNIQEYDEILLQWSRELAFYLRRLGAKKETAEDMAQESLLTLIEYEDDLPFNKLKPWLFRVGINRYLDNYRKETRRREILMEDYLPLMKEMSEKENPQVEIFKESFLTLSLFQQTLLFMKYEENYSIETMGFLLKRPQESLKTELYRTRKKLRKIMKEREEKIDE